MARLVESYCVGFNTKRLFERLGINQELNPKIMEIEHFKGITVLTIQRDAQKGLHMKITEEERYKGIKELVDDETYKKHLEIEKNLTIEVK